MSPHSGIFYIWSEAKFLVPDRGVIAVYIIRLSYRPAYVSCGPVRQPYATVDNILQTGAKNLASDISLSRPGRYLHLHWARWRWRRWRWRRHHPDRALRQQPHARRHLQPFPHPRQRQSLWSGSQVACDNGHSCCFQKQSPDGSNGSDAALRVSDGMRRYGRS